MKKDKLVCIEWDDACSHDTWIDREDAKPYVYRVRSVGFLVAENAHSVRIVTNASNNGKVSEGMTIPKGMIRKRKTVATYPRLDK